MSHEKRIYLFVPPGTDTEHLIVQRLSSQFPPLETNTFESFYNRRIRHYSAKPPKCFCNGLEELLDFAGDLANHITLVSMDDTHVYALAIVNIRPKQRGQKVDMYIELLCGNKALPRTGEGSRLLKILEDVGFETGNHKIHLDSAPDAVNYYTDRSYHVLPSYRPDIDLVPMSKDTKALSRWKKIKSTFSAKTQSYFDSKYSEMRSSRAKGKRKKNNSQKNKKNKSKKNKSKKNKKKKE